MKKALTVVTIILIVVLVVLRYTRNTAEQAKIDGFISSVKTTEGTIRVYDNKNRPYTVAIDPNSTRVLDETENRKDINYLRRGFSVVMSGMLNGGLLRAEDIKVSNAPAVIVYSPAKGAKVSSPFGVYGEARIFARQLHYIVANSTGTVLGSGDVPVGGGIGVYGPFSGSVSYSDPKTSTGSLEIFHIGRSGEELDKVTVQLDFQ